MILCGSLPLWFRSSRILRRPKTPTRVLTATEYAIFAAAAARICPRDQAGVGWPTSEAIDCAGTVDTIMSGLHPRAAGEFKKLLHVFESGMTGLLLIGSPSTFTASTNGQQDRRLDAWRRSQVALFRSGYQAMKRLAHATYYASADTFSRVGYPGPPAVPRGP